MILGNSSKIQKEVFRHIGFIVCVSLLITLVLFRGGNILGGGEVGAAFYSPLRIFEMIRYSWSSVHLGITSGLMPASAPIFATMGLLEAVGVSTVVIQALFFLSVMLLSMISMYFLAKELFPKRDPILWFLAALFYHFNPYSTLNVWNRFLPNTMLYYAFIPLSWFVFIRGINRKDYRYAILLGLLTAIFSYAFSAPAQTLIYWALIFLTSLYFLIISPEKKFIAKYSILAVLSWIPLNFWWISQQFTFLFTSSYSTATENFFTNLGNINTFNSLSRSLGQLGDLFLLRHGRISHQAEGYPYGWPHFYASPVYEVAGWIVLLVSIFFSAKRLRNRIVSYLLFLFALGIFLSKGNLPPFGTLFNEAFERFIFLQFFRNPFEKLGFISAFSFSLILGFGLSRGIIAIRSQRVRRLAYFAVLLFILLFNGFPYFTGLVFTSNLHPANDPKVGIQVDVPEYYKDANRLLSSRCDNCRYIAFPLGLGEGIYYNWPKGYVGLEQMGFLFNNPGISHHTTLPYYGEISQQLERLLIQNPDFYKVASLLNVKHVILREDVDFLRSRMKNPTYLKNTLEGYVVDDFTHLQSPVEMGELSIYQYTDEVITPKIYPASRAIVTGNSDLLESVFLTNFQKNGVLYTSEFYNSTRKYFKDAPTFVFANYTSFEILGPNFPIYSEEPYIFPYIRHTANSKYFELVLLKERLASVLKSSKEEQIYLDMLNLGKRLKEVESSIRLSDYESARKSLLLYKARVVNVFDELGYLTIALSKPNERVWNEESITKLFGSHLYLLQQFEKSPLNSNGDVSEVLTTLRELSVNTEVLPYWDVTKTAEFPISNRKVYRIRVEEPGEYEILLPKTKFFPNDFWEDGGVWVQIDDKIERRAVEDRNKNISLGRRFFDEGIHEVGFNQLTDVNLVSLTEFELTAKDEPVRLEIPIDRYSPFDHYFISFDYYIEYGDGLKVIMNNDNDFVEEGRGYYFEKVFSPDNYFFGERHFAQSISGYSTSTNSKMIFEVKPWNNCREVYKNREEKCNDPSVSNLFKKPTKVKITNLRFSPKFPDKMYLVSETDNDFISPPTVDFQMINSTKYKVAVNGSQEPFLLVFSEAYDSKWKAYIDNQDLAKDGKSNINDTWGLNAIDDASHILVNGYANAWWIDHHGDFEVIIEYAPQRLLYVGYFISFISFVSGVSALIYLSYRKKHEKNNQT